MCNFINIFGKIFCWHIKYDIKVPSHVIHAIDTLYNYSSFLILKKTIIFPNTAFFFLLIKRKPFNKIRKLFKTDWLRKCFIFTHTHYAFLSYRVLHISLNVYIIITYNILSQGKKLLFFIWVMLQKYGTYEYLIFLLIYILMVTKLWVSYNHNLFLQYIINILKSKINRRNIISILIKTLIAW